MSMAPFVPLARCERHPPEEVHGTNAVYPGGQAGHFKLRGVAGEGQPGTTGTRLDQGPKKGCGTKPCAGPIVRALARGGWVDLTFLLLMSRRLPPRARTGRSATWRRRRVAHSPSAGSARAPDTPPPECQAAVCGHRFITESDLAGEVEIVPPHDLQRGGFRRAVRDDETSTERAAKIGKRNRLFTSRHNGRRQGRPPAVRHQVQPQRGLDRGLQMHSQRYGPSEYHIELCSEPILDDHKILHGLAQTVVRRRVEKRSRPDRQVRKIIQPLGVRRCLGLEGDIPSRDGRDTSLGKRDQALEFYTLDDAPPMGLPSSSVTRPHGLWGQPFMSR